MKITDVKARLLSFPVPKERQWRSDLGVMAKMDTVIVQIDTDEGTTGIGSAQGHPEVLKAIVETQLKPALVGEDPTFTERLWEKLYNGSRYQPSLDRGISQPGFSRRGDTLAAIAGADIALWDIHGKTVGQPIYKLLGAARTKIRGYASGGWAPGDEAEKELAGYAAKGFTAVKMRAEGRDGFSFKKSIHRIKAARRGIGPDVELMVDAHGSFDVSTATRLATQMEEYDIAWFEEPVSADDHVGQAEVRHATSIPIASGESESTRFETLDLLSRRAVDIIQPDIAVAGGFTEVRRIATLAYAYGVRFAPHVWSSGVLFAASIHIAMAMPNCHIFEVSQGTLPLIWDLMEESFEIKDGYVYAPDRPGLGYTLREDIEERFPYIPGPNYVY